MNKKKIEKYISLLLKYKTSINIIGTQDKNVLTHIIQDSIIEIEKNTNVLDIGCGAGIPGVPIKIYNPSINIYFMDKSRKKINILKYILLNLDIDYKKCLIGHSDSFINDYKNFFDTIISRGMGNINYTLTKIIPFIKRNRGSIYLWKPSNFKISSINKKKYNIKNISSINKQNCKIVRISFFS